MDFAFDRSLECHQQEAKVGGDMDELGRNLDVPINTATLEMQGIAFPTIRDVEFFSDMVGDALHRFPGFGQGAGMRTLDFDAGHGLGSRRKRRLMRPILLAFSVSTKNGDRAVC